MMNTKNLIVICVAFYITTMTIGLLWWPTVYRYETVTFGSIELIVRINRLTGSVMEYSFNTGSWRSSWVSIGQVEEETKTPRKLGRGTFGR